MREVKESVIRQAVLLAEPNHPISFPAMITGPKVVRHFLVIDDVDAERVTKALAHFGFKPRLFLLKKSDFKQERLTES